MQADQFQIFRIDPPSTAELEDLKKVLNDEGEASIKATILKEINANY